MKQTKLQIGCYLDHGCRSATELAADIVDLAIGMGMPKPEGWDELDCDKDDDCEAIDWEMDNAIDWMNDQDRPSYCHWANDGYAGAFGLWPSVDSAREQLQDDGFVSSREQEYPADDYQGEWLHVNERGNCVLYVRENGKDTEIWSLV